MRARRNRRCGDAQGPGGQLRRHVAESACRMRGRPVPAGNKPWKAGPEGAKDPAARRKHRATEHRGHRGGGNLGLAEVRKVQTRRWMKIRLQLLSE